MTILASLKNQRLTAGHTPLILGGAMAAVTAVTAVATDEGPILCPFRRVTGGYCPGCGGTRAAKALVRGDLELAWQTHPWVVLLAVQAMLATTIAAMAFRSRPLTAWRSTGGRLIAANAAVGVGLWIVRLVDGQIPVPFG